MKTRRMTSKKRAMSPLIATMLLVALAVAIGTSFVSYFGVYFQNKSPNKTADCQEYGVNFFKLDKSKGACSQFNTQYVLKFWNKTEPISESGCYVSVSSGKGQICHAQKPLTDNVWSSTENSKVG